MISARPTTLLYVNCTSHVSCVHAPTTPFGLSVQRSSRTSKRSCRKPYDPKYMQAQDPLTEEMSRNRRRVHMSFLFPNPSRRKVLVSSHKLQIVILRVIVKILVHLNLVRFVFSRPGRLVDLTKSFTVVYVHLLTPTLSIGSRSSSL